MIQSDDVSSRLNAIKKLSTIAVVLGPERTRDDLVPFLESTCFRATTAC